MDGRIIGQILGILATILTFMSYQFNRKKVLLFIQMAATASNCFAYFFLDGGTAFILNFICIGRNLVYAFQESGTRINRISALLFSGAMIVVGAFSWNGPASLLVIVALAINTYVLSLGKPQTLRYSLILTCTLTIVYNVFVGAYGSIMNECVAMVSAVIGIIRFRNVKDDNEKKAPAK